MNVRRKLDQHICVIFTFLSLFAAIGKFSVNAQSRELIVINIGATESALVVSPLYPSNYENNVYTTWLIQTVDNYRIRASFNSFSTESWFDLLEAGDGRDSGNSSTRFFLWSGSTLPPDLLSNGNAMWLRFTSDRSITDSGFSLLTQSVPSSGCVFNSYANNRTCHSGFTCECTRNFYGTLCEIELIVINIGANESALVVSPFYPSNYENNLNTIWLIQTVDNYRIRASFNSFSTDSCCDHLEAGECGDSGNSSTRFFRWSGRNLPPDLLSRGNALWLKFTSDYSVTDSGFSLLAQSVPPSGGCVFNSCANNGTCQPVGRSGFTCECPDNFGGTLCEIDNEDPVLTCPPDETVGTDPGLTTAIATWVLATVTDNSMMPITPEANVESGSPFGIGTTPVVFEAVDDSGNTGNCTFTITVEEVFMATPM